MSAGMELSPADSGSGEKGSQRCRFHINLLVWGWEVETLHQAFILVRGGIAS